MSIRLFFFKTDLKADTGFRYIFNQVKTIKSIDTTVDEFNCKTKFHIVKLPILIMYLFIASLLVKRTIDQKDCIVGFPKNWREIATLKQRGYNLYLVDSIYDYYNLRLENRSQILKFLILKICTIYEILLLTCIDNKLFLNSIQASNSMKGRYGEFANRIAYLPIGITTDQYKSEKISVSPTLSRGKKIIGIWANFNFHENKYGLERFLQRLLEQKNFDVNFDIKIAGGGLDSKFKMKFQQTGIEFLGRIDNLEQFISNCDGFVLAVERTNGIKTKLLELVKIGMPFMVKQSILSHIELDNEIIKNAFVSDDYQLAAFADFISEYSATENVTSSCVSWDKFIHILQREAV